SPLTPHLPTLVPRPSSPARDGQDRFEQRRFLAEPIDPGRPTSPWLVRPEGLTTDWARLVGPSDYQAHLGANSGGANGVYWLHVLGEADGGVLVRNIAARGKRSVATVEQVIEPDLVYPLLRWADVARYRAAPSAHLLLVQDLQTRRGIEEQVLRDRYPKTYAYLERFAPALRDRAAYKRYQRHAAFYSMYNVGRYTVAPVKVVWRRMDRRVNAAVVEVLEDPILGARAAIPQETCVLVAARSSDEAHYLSAVLNSAIVGFLVTSHSVRGGKGFGSPGMLDFIRLRQFEPGAPLHQELAMASRRAHQSAERGEPIFEIQREIDEMAGRLWGLARNELHAIQRELIC
ncbi:MAG: SAM-dependent DNA methyltransferase, partial [Planctomycetota bacterium]